MTSTEASDGIVDKVPIFQEQKLGILQALSKVMRDPKKMRGRGDGPILLNYGAA